MAVQVGKEEEEEDTAAVGDLTVAFEENLFLSQEEVEEYDRPVTPPAQIQATGLLRDDAPSSSKVDSFVIEERKEVLSVVTWNTHPFRFLNKPEQRMGMARVLSRYDLVLLQEIPCGEKARESLEYFCSVMNPFDFLLSETLTVSSSSLNAILFRRAEWHVVHTTSLSHHLYPPVAALLKRKGDDLKVFVSSVHVSPSSFSATTTTPAKNGTATPARIRAQKETMQARIYSEVTEIHALARAGAALLLLTLWFSWLGTSTGSRLPLSRLTSPCTPYCLLSFPRPSHQGARWTTSS